MYRYSNVDIYKMSIFWEAQRLKDITEFDVQMDQVWNIFHRIFGT